MNHPCMPWMVTCLALLVQTPASRTQEPAVAKAPQGILLRVEGEDSRKLELTAKDLARLPHRTVRAKDHDGKESTFEGVPLVEMLKSASVKFGQDLRGKALATYLLVEAADEYRVVCRATLLIP